MSLWTFWCGLKQKKVLNLQLLLLLQSDVNKRSHQLLPDLICDSKTMHDTCSPSHDVFSSSSLNLGSFLSPWLSKLTLGCAKQSCLGSNTYLSREGSVIARLSWISHIKISQSVHLPEQPSHSVSHTDSLTMETSTESCDRFWLKIDFIWYMCSHSCSPGFYLHVISFLILAFLACVCPQIFNKSLVGNIYFHLSFIQPL
jgi:hypothetical protein